MRLWSLFIVLLDILLLLDCEVFFLIDIGLGAINLLFWTIYFECVEKAVYFWEENDTLPLR